MRRGFVPIILVGEDSRIVVATVDDGFARFAESQGTRQVKRSARDKHSALRVKDLSTRPAVVFPPESGKGTATVETVLGILIFHPELFADDPALQMSRHNGVKLYLPCLLLLLASCPSKPFIMVDGRLEL